jgi:hypothetical protein
MLTKAEIIKLPVEQQELVAKMELSRTQRRQKLLEQARGLDWRARYFQVLIFASFLLLLAFYYFVSVSRADEKVKAYYLCTITGVLFVNFVIGMHARLNRRLDALLKLLDEEGKLQSDGK